MYVFGDSGYDLNCRQSCWWAGKCMVYTRKIHKITQKTCDTNKDTVTTAASTAAASAVATASENPTTTLTPTKVSSTTAASASTAEVSTTSTSKDRNDSAVVSTTSTAPCGHAATTGNGVGHTLEALEDRKTDLADIQVCSLHEPRLDVRVQHSSSLSEDNYSNRHQGQEGSGSQRSELYSKNSSLANWNDTENLEKTSALHGKQDGDCLPNGREVSSLQLPAGNELQKDGELVAVPPQVPSDNGLSYVNGFCNPLTISIFEGRVRFKLAKATSKDEIKTIQKKFECELDQVRGLVKQVEPKELQLASYNSWIRDSNLSYSSNHIGNEGGDTGGHGYPQLQDARIDLVDRKMEVRATSAMGHQEIRPNGLARANSDVGAVRDLQTRPYSRQLSVAVMENNYETGLFVEKEKRIPKANRYYRDLEFLLGKDWLPPESNKRLKTNSGRRQRGQFEHAFRFANGFDKSRNQVFKSCNNLLQRLMKHNHGWVFNEPVNAKSMGLADYHDIIKHPMDLGTIKTRLSINWFKSPREFAGDVRLVFQNAMTYNPKGHDVHLMAEQLLQIFEERWVTIENEYNHLWKYQMHQDAGLPTPNSRKAPPLSHFVLASSETSVPSLIPGLVSNPVRAPACIPASAPVSWHAATVSQMRTLDRPDTMSALMAADPRVQWPHAGRPPVLKKPKAKDSDKRDMTFDEKQRLSTNLQSLPVEKLDAIIQIIKKRNTALSQHDDEIEVDIDNVDAETLWELDRFVTNYRKSSSKNRRKTEIVHRARPIRQLL